MVAKKCVTIICQSNIRKIGEKEIKISTPQEIVEVPNDYVYIFAGGELPNEFLNKIGVQIEKRFGT
ncbi:MAG TPA: hypothetical protein VJL62_00500 [Thermodesulfobacteriota bacterium]|nr:hypothetical protein [Thermodesulfobacteriota bacterium]